MRRIPLFVVKKTLLVQICGLELYILHKYVDVIELVFNIYFLKRWFKYCHTSETQIVYVFIEKINYS